MEVLAALGHGGDEGNTEAATPVAKEVGERRGLVVLVGFELRIRNDRQRHEEKGVAETLQSAGQGVVTIVRIEVEVAVVEERNANDHQRTEEQDARLDDAALHQLGADWRKHSDDQRPRPEYESGVDGAI